MALLTAGTIVAMPLELPILTPGLSISARAILVAIVPVMVIPFVAGALARTASPRMATACLPMARGIANASAILLLVLVIGLNTSALWSVVGSGALAASVLFLSIMFAIGYLGGGAGKDVRAGLGLSTAARNIGAALPVAAASRDHHVMVMVLVATVAELLVCLAAVALLRRHKKEAPPADAPAEPMATTSVTAHDAR
jgi:predicted Na+-dependent transporter